MGRYKNCQEILTYYAEANRMCLSIKPGRNCDACPLKEGDGCGKTIFSFALDPEERAKDTNMALKKIYAVQVWSDEHPEEEDTNDVI